MKHVVIKWVPGLKFLLGSALLFLVGYQLVQAFQGLSTRDCTMLRPDWWWLGVALLLMPLNWYLEVAKWRVFQAEIVRLSWRKSWYAVLLGIAWSFLTPNRSGEYVARALVSGSPTRWSGLQASAGAAFCQVLVLIGMGIPAVWLFLVLNSQETGGYWLFTGIMGSTLLGVLLIGVYLRKIGRMLSERIKSTVWRQWLAHLESIAGFSGIQIGLGILLSMARYGVYMAQYQCMLYFTGVELAPIAVFAGVGTIYLIQTGLPLPPVFGFLARGEVALLIWKNWNIGAVQVLTSSYGLFALNLALPALVGVVWMFQETLKKQRSTHEKTNFPVK